MLKPMRSLVWLVPCLGALGACSVLVDTEKTRLGSVDGGATADRREDRTADSSECSPVAVCTDGVLNRCEDGEPVTETCALGCASTEVRCARMVPSNVSADLWDEEAANVILPSDAEVRFDTSTCDAAMTSTQVVTQSDGSEACVLQAGNFEVGENAILTITGNRPLILMSSGNVVIDGVIDVSARGPEPGPGGFAGGQLLGNADGEGPGHGSGGSHASDDSDGGGGGGGLCGMGGDGGVGSGTAGGVGGESIAGDWRLVPLHGGSGGGRGRGLITMDSIGSAGGAGGGALQISALGNMTVRGGILAGGGGGRGGSSAIMLPTSTGSSGGGGGSGGTVLLEALSVTLSGDGFIRAIGGAGGGGADDTSSGGTGEDGVLAVTRAGGGASGGDLGADGGDSGGDDQLPGDSGRENNRRGGNGGGGGGSAGCVVVHAADGRVPGRARINPRTPPGIRTGMPMHD